MRLVTLTAVLAAIALTACEGAVGTVSINIVTSPGSDLLERVQTARVTLSNPRTIVSAERDAQGNLLIDLEVVADGQAGEVTIDGFDASENLIAFGRSGPLPINAIDAVIDVFLGPPESITEAPAMLDPPRSEVATAILSFGVLVAGGRLADGNAAADVAIYNVYDHDFQIGDSMPEARADLTAITGANGGVYLFGGNNSAGDPQSTLLRFDTTVDPAGAYSTLVSQAAFARAGASAAPIGNDSFIVPGDPAIFIDGPAGQAGAFPDAPPLAGTAKAAAPLGDIIVLIAGDGTATSGAVLYNGQFSELIAPAEILRTGHTSVAVPDNFIVVIGGEDASGLLASAVRFDALLGSFQTVPDVLETPRTGAAIAASRDRIIVAGGRDASGTLVPTVEIIDARTLEHIDTVPMVAPRTNATAAELINGQILIVGGSDDSGQPVGVLELFTPGE